MLCRLLVLCISARAVSIPSSEPSSGSLQSSSRLLDEPESSTAGPFDEYKYYLEASYAAYCSSETLAAWNCSWCKKVNPSQDVTVHGVATQYPSQGYVVTMPGKGILVGFRGTKEWYSWVQSLTFPLEQLHWEGVPSDLYVHRGFLWSYNDIRTEMLQFTEQALADCPRCDITVVGHSLGAAQAALFIADIKTNSSIAKDTDSFYTFGSPRIGNRNWANWLHTITPVDTFRVVNDMDLVPHAPTWANTSSGYHHIPTEVWLKHPNNNSAKICNGDGEDVTCSFQYSLAQTVASGHSIDDHLNYLGVPIDINGC